MYPGTEPHLEAPAEWEEDESYVDYYYDEPGSLPGTLMIDEDASPTTVVLIDYSPAKVKRIPVKQPEDCSPYLERETVSWIDVQGLGSEDILRRLGQVFGLHPLALEDVVNVPQRPKVEQYRDQILLITRMVLPRADGKGFLTEQVSFILGKHYLLTIQEEAGHDTFGSARERIRTDKGVIRNQGSDYLAYTLLDTIVDGFFPILEIYGEQLEELEDQVVRSPNRQTLERIHHLKRGLFSLRRLIWPLRDAINITIRDTGDLISPEVRVYLRDCYDHTIQVMDIVETYRELASSLMDVYLSSLSNKMNEIMKILTVISTIFIPLTFIVGVYGMNFNPDTSPFNMPELNWYWGYPACWALMLIVSISLILFFRQRGWFENLSIAPPNSEDPAS